MATKKAAKKALGRKAMKKTKGGLTYVATSGEGLLSRPPHASELTTTNQTYSLGVGSGGKK